MFSIIAAVGRNRELGNKGELVFRLKNDMKFFKEKTTGHKVVMGRKTWESLPHKLPERQNIVVSRHGTVTGADETVADLDAFREARRGLEEEIFVIGGAKIYEEFIDTAEKIYLTEVDAEAEADVFFPEFDKSKYDRKVVGEGEENGIKYQFVLYERKN